jgi:hypothetical protein
MLRSESCGSLVRGYRILWVAMATEALETSGGGELFAMNPDVAESLIVVSLAKVCMYAV